MPIKIIKVTLGLSIFMLSCRSEQSTQTSANNDSIKGTVAGERLSDIVFSCIESEKTEPRQVVYPKEIVALTQPANASDVAVVTIYAKRKIGLQAPVRILEMPAESLISSADTRVSCTEWVSSLNAFSLKKQIYLSELTLEPVLAVNSGRIVFGPLSGPNDPTPRFLVSQSQLKCLMTASFGPLCPEQQNPTKSRNPAFQTYNAFAPAIVDADVGSPKTDSSSAVSNILYLGKHIQSR